MARDDLVVIYRDDVERYLAHYHKTVMAHVDNLLQAEGLIAHLMNDRFVEGLRADLVAYGQSLPVQEPERRLGRVGYETIARAMTDPQRGSLWSHLKERTAARLRQADWLRDNTSFRNAVDELVRKKLRGIVTGEGRELRDKLLTLYTLLLLQDAADVSAASG